MTQPIDALSAKATAIASQGAAARKLDSTLAKLTAATAVKPASPTGLTGDAASLTDANVLKAVRDTAPLRELGSRLIDLRRLVAGAQGAERANDAQSKINASLAAIRHAAETFRGSDRGNPLSPFGPASEYTPTDIAGDVTDIELNVRTLASGVGLDINVHVTQSAQAGALALSFGAANLDLGAAGVSDPNALFEIEIAGSQGARVLSFSSGTTLDDIADTINAFTKETGVIAGVSGTAIRLGSPGLNDESFVSVRVLDDGDIAGSTTGVYSFVATDNYSADTGTRVAFESASNRLVDYGQDLVAFINGVRATNRGDTAISADLGDAKVSFDIGVTRAQWHDTFHAFTIVEQSDAAAVDRVVSLDSKSAFNQETLAILDDAIREVERAEREELLARAGGEIALDDSEIPVIREAQAKLLEEARRLGLLVDHDPAKALEALRG